ncbi:MAG: hypothetical protein AB1529_03725 [Candidatus Micrarchaeota archaeon]
MGVFRERQPVDETQRLTQLQAEGPIRQQPQPTPGAQQAQPVSQYRPPETPQVQDARQAQQLSSSLSQTGQSLTRPAETVASQLPFTERAAQQRQEEITEGRKTAESEFPSETAIVKSLGDKASEEMGKSKEARAAGDKRGALDHAEKACALYNEAAEKTSALEKLSATVSELKSEKALEEVITALKAPVPLDKLTLSSAREVSEYAASASADLKTAALKDKAAIGAIHARGIAALKAGKADEASLHKELAKAYPRAGPKNRKVIEKASSESAKGRMGAADVLAMMSMLRKSPSGAGIPPGKIRERIVLLQAKLKGLSSLPGLASRLAEIEALVGPALRYIAKAEEMRKTGDDAKAGEYEDLAVRHLDEAESLVAGLEKPGAVPSPPPAAHAKPEAKAPARPALGMPEAAPPKPAEIPEEPGTPPGLTAFLNAEFSGRDGELKGLLMATGEKPEDLLKSLGGIYVEKIAGVMPKLKDDALAAAMTHLVSMAKPTLEDLESARDFYKSVTMVAPPKPEAAKAAEGAEEAEKGIPADLMGFLKAEYAGREGMLEDLRRAAGEKPEGLLKALGGIYSEKISRVMEKLKEDHLIVEAMSHLTSMENPTLGDIKLAREFYERVAPAWEEKPRVKLKAEIEYAFAPAAAKPAPPTGAVTTPAEAKVPPAPVPAAGAAKAAEKPAIAAGPSSPVKAFLEEAEKLGTALAKASPSLAAQLDSMLAPLRASPSPEEAKRARAAAALSEFYLGTKDPERRKELEAVLMNLAGGKIKTENAFQYLLIFSERAEAEALGKSDKGREKAAYEIAIAEMGKLAARTAKGESIGADEHGRASALVLCARAFAAGKSKVDRNYALSLSRRLSAGEIATDDAIWLANLQLTRAGTHSAIVDSLKGKEEKNVLVNANAYYDNAAMLFERGDKRGAEAALGMAALLAGAAAHGDKGAEAVAFVYSVMGDYSGSPAARERILGKAPDELGSKIAPVPPAAPLFRAAASPGSSFEKELGAGGSSMSLFALDLARHSEKVERLDFESDASFIGKPHAKKKFDHGKSRLEKASVKAGKAGKPDEAARLGEEAERCDYEKMKARADDSRKLYDEGAKEVEKSLEIMRRAVSLTAEAGKETDPKKEAELLSGAEALSKEAFELNAKGMAIKNAAKSGIDALSALGDSITGVSTLHRERGRRELDLAAAAFHDVGLKIAGTGAISAADVARMEAATDAAAAGKLAVEFEKTLTRVIATETAKYKELVARDEENAGKYCPDGKCILMPVPEGKKILAKDSEGRPITGKTSEGRDIVWTTPAYNAADMKERLARGKAALAKEDVAGAVKARAGAAAAMALYERRTSVVLASRGLLADSGDVEMATGVMNEFKTSDLLASLSEASGYMGSGDLDTTMKKLAGFDSEFEKMLVLQSASNVAAKWDKIAFAYELRAKELRGFGTPTEEEKREDEVLKAKGIEPDKRAKDEHNAHLSAVRLFITAPMAAGAEVAGTEALMHAAAAKAELEKMRGMGSAERRAGLEKLAGDAWGGAGAFARRAKEFELGKWAADEALRGFDLAARHDWGEKFRKPAMDAFQLGMLLS